MAKEDWFLKRKEGNKYFLANKWDSGCTKEIGYNKYGNKETTYKRNGSITKKYPSRGFW